MKLFATYCLVALRNVKRNPRRSLFTIGAISFGLFCLLIFQGLKTGLHREMVTGTVNLDSGVLQIHAKGYEVNLAALQPLENSDHVVDLVRRHKGVSYAPRLKAPALILAGRRSSSVMLSGINPEQEATVTFIHSRVVTGSYLEEEGSALLGQELAESLDVGRGDSITLMAQDVFGSPVIKKFTVGGLYRTGLASFNRTHIFLRLPDVQSLLGVGSEWTEIAFQGNTAAIQGLAVSLSHKLPEEKYQIRTWDEIAPDVRQLIDLNDATMTLLIIIVFAIVAMGITNTMTTGIFERFREIGILTTIGTTPAGIIGMIMLESLLLGLAASVFGSLTGGLAGWHLAQTGIDLTGFTSNNQYFTGSHVLKASLTWADCIMANAVTLLTSLVAGIYPAARAARIEPMKAIHHT